MYEKLSARLDESYTHFGTGQRITRIREITLTAVPTTECGHTAGTICHDCAASWQGDYEFADPFPFERVPRVTLRDLIDAGRLKVGDTLSAPGTDVSAVITSTGGLMLPDGRIFDNPSAAANALAEN